jgi:RNA polymerase sigma factor (sigma-70 family)
MGAGPIMACAGLVFGVAVMLELLPERIDLVGVVLQLSGLGSLVGLVFAVALGKDEDAYAKRGTLVGAYGGLFLFVALGRGWRVGRLKGAEARRRVAARPPSAGLPRSGGGTSRLQPAAFGRSCACAVGTALATPPASCHKPRRLGKVRGVGTVWERSTDEELLAATRHEPAAFGAFYRRYERRLLRFFLKRVGDVEVAADLTAETFAAALSATQRFRGRKEPASAWLFGIARNILAMSRRRGRVEARARRRLGMPALVLSDELLERAEALDSEALELVDVLPPEQGAAVRARIIEEREYSEIAKDLRCSEAVVRKRVSRGLAEVRDRLGER